MFSIFLIFNFVQSMIGFQSEPLVIDIGMNVHNLLVNCIAAIENFKPLLGWLFLTSGPFSRRSRYCRRACGSHDPVRSVPVLRRISAALKLFVIVCSNLTSISNNDQLSANTSLQLYACFPLSEPKIFRSAVHRNSVRSQMPDIWTSGLYSFSVTGVPRAAHFRRWMLC